MITIKDVDINENVDEVIVSTISGHVYNGTVVRRQGGTGGVSYILLNTKFYGHKHIRESAISTVRKYSTKTRADVINDNKSV